MAIGYDPYGDNGWNLYQPFQDANTGMNGQPWGQPQPIDQGQGMTPMQWYQQNNAGGFTGYNPNAGQGGSVSQQPNWQSPNVSPDQVSSYFASRGTTPNGTSPGYWASKWPELYQRGLELGNPNYAYQRLQYADEFLPGGPSTSPFAEPAQSGGSAYGGGTSQIASVNPSNPAGSGTVSPTYTAMLSNGSSYAKPGDQNLQNTMNRNNQGLTLAQLIGMGR